MKVLANKTGELYLEIQNQDDDTVIVQFIDNFGSHKGQPFKDSLSSLQLVGWKHISASMAIGMHKFQGGICEDLDVSLALHQAFPLGRKVSIPKYGTGHIASYANTHVDGYYMYIRFEEEIVRIKMDTSWRLLPSEKLLALPYYPRPKTAAELTIIDDYDKWFGGF